MYQLSLICSSFSCITSSNIGGRLAFYWQAWGEIWADQWVLQTVKEGYLIPFKTKPPLSLNTIQCPAYHQGSERAEALTNVVVDMLQKGAIEPVQTCSSGFYSRLFIVLKASGSWRPVIELSTLVTFHGIQFPREYFIIDIRPVPLGHIRMWHSLLSRDSRVICSRAS